jgi:hypothetical protein
MDNSTLELQAKMFVFDLGNCAKEYWFKDDESWNLCLASSEQKADIEKKYSPTMSKKGLPETLFQLHNLVNLRLLKVNPRFLKLGHFEAMSTEPEFLIAFNSNRLR